MAGGYIGVSGGEDRGVAPGRDAAVGGVGGEGRGRGGGLRVDVPPAGKVAHAGVGEVVGCEAEDCGADAEG